MYQRFKPDIGQVKVEPLRPQPPPRFVKDLSKRDDLGDLGDNCDDFQMTVDAISDLSNVIGDPFLE